MKRYPDLLIRLPFAATFIIHGAGKLVMLSESAAMMGMPVALVLVIGLAEFLAGTGALAGAFPGFGLRRLATRLAGLAAAPVMIGAIAMVHWPKWSFTASPTHPMGGMEFQVLLLGVALTFLLHGGIGEQKPGAPAA